MSSALRHAARAAMTERRTADAARRRSWLGPLARLWNRFFPVPAALVGSVRQAQFDTLLQQGPTVLAVQAVLAPVAVLLLWGQLPPTLLVGWLALIEGFVAYRLLRWRLRRSATKAPRDPARTVRRVTLHTLLASLIWVFLTAVALPRVDPVTQALLVMVLCGLAGGMAASCPSVPSMVMTFIAPVLLAPAAQLAALDGRAAPIIGGLLALNFVALTMLARVSFVRALQSVALAQNFRDVKEQLTESLHAVEDAFVLCDASLKIIHLNDNVGRLLRIEEAAAKFVGGPVERLLVALTDEVWRVGLEKELDRRAWSEALMKAVGGDHRSELEIRMKDGHTWSLKVQRTRTGLRVVSIADVSRIMEAERRLVDALESLPDGFVIWNRHGRLIRHNAAFEAIFEGTDIVPKAGDLYAPLLRKAVKQGMFPEAEGREQAFLKARLEGRGAERSDWVGRLKNGRYYRFIDRRTRDGGSVGLRQDITAIVEAHMKLEAGRRELAQRVAELEAKRWELDDERQRAEDLARRLGRAA
jgi:PAS domain-containing protein